VAGLFKSWRGVARTLALMLSHLATGMPASDAHDDFARARRAQLAARVARALPLGRRRSRVPRTLADAAALPHGAPVLKVIALQAIVGTVEPTITFDARFRPASEHVRARWERVALAHRRSIALPPITVRQSSDGYYVVDGRHRVSVALALGHRDIEAWVTETGSLSSPALAAAA
jgi:hypothetical protein